jgi:hypothetical protein
MTKQHSYARAYSRFSILTVLSIAILFQLLIQETNGRYIRSISTRRIQEEEEDVGENDFEDQGVDDEEGGDLEELTEDLNELIEEVAEGVIIEVDTEETEVVDDIENQDDEEILDDEEDELMDQEDENVYPDEDEDADEDEDDIKVKPIMHTFFQRIDPEHHHEGTTFNKGTGMSTDKGHAELLAAWEFGWQTAGFDTRILNIEDVEKHANYKKIRKFLDGEAFGEYDELCFLRWFAMAASGGGWMSDYDVVPLKSLVPHDILAAPRKLDKSLMEGNNGIPLPNKGTFTIFDSDGRVPSLMSGSAKEWERLANGLMDLARKHTDDFYSDMYAINDYDKEHKKSFEKASDVVYRLADVVDTNGLIDCEKVWKEAKKHNWAVHFSHWNIHDAVENGILDGSVTHDDRPWIAREFIADWDQQCGEDFKDEE